MYVLMEQDVLYQEVLFYKDLNQNPMKAILECYDKYKKKLNVEFVNHQIIFKKLI
jgi:hypothetical protein